MLPQIGLAATVEVALITLMRALGVVLHPDVRLQIPLHCTIEITELAAVGLLPCVDSHVSLQIRVDLKLGVTEDAVERRVSGV